MEYLVQKPAQLASHLRSLRRARGLTQAQLGARVGLDQTRIAKIERNPRLVSVGQLLQLLSALEVQVALLPLGKERLVAKSDQQSGRKSTGPSRGDADLW